MVYDLVIIGGGPSGINCGIAAQQAGLNYIILEKGKLVNSLYNFPANMTFFSTSKKLEIGNIPFISHVDKPTRKEALEYYRRLVTTYDLPIKYYEAVTAMSALETDEGYIISTTKGVYRSFAVVVATGYYDTPRLLNIPGETLPKVTHYYDDPHPYVGQKVLVIGAANSACDVALETYYKGAEVTMAIRGAGIYEKVKYWIKPNIENRIKEGAIRAYFHTTVQEIRPQTVVLQTPEGEQIIENDFVLAMTGYQPNYDFMRRLGIEIPDDEKRIPAYNNENLETNLPRVYLAGVVCAGMQTSKLFIENTRDHGQIIIADIRDKLSVGVG
ncbi:MAG: YpdA family putative bacillithiol disulfide reductase [Bacteroidota bacterium]